MPSVNSYNLAGRIRRIKPSPSTMAADRANELRRQGKQIVSLVVGEPDFDTPAHIRKAAGRAMDNESEDAFERLRTSGYM